jgi:hypothetical protein
VSKRLYVLTILGGILSWAMVGMSLSGVLAATDAGAAPARLDLVLLAIWTITGSLDAWALLRLPVSPNRRAASGAPAT